MSGWFLHTRPPDAHAYFSQHCRTGRGALGAVSKVLLLDLGVVALILSSIPLEGMEFRFMPIDQGIASMQEAMFRKAFIWS